MRHHSVFIAILVISSSLVIPAASTAFQGTVATHSCSSTDSKTVKGTITVSNCDHTALTSQKDTIAKSLATQVQSSAVSNTKCQVTVDAVTDLGNGNLTMTYTCTGVSDHTACQTALHKASACDDVKQTVAKCSKTGNTATNLAQMTQAAKPQATAAAPKATQNDVVTSGVKTTGPAVASHSCSSVDSKTIKGTIVLQNVDKTSLASQKDAISKTLTSQCQSSCSSKSTAQVAVDGVTEIGDGTLHVAYTCSGVEDHASCQDSLHKAAQCDEIKATVGKCSHSNGNDAKTTAKAVVVTVPKNTGPAVASHSCSSVDSKTIKGTIVLQNVDKTSLASQKDAISKTLT
ncbi:unnamed protein product, partial [Adineta ricciae]